MNYLKQLLLISKDFTVTGRLKSYFKTVLIWCPLASVLFTLGFNGFDHFFKRFLISMVISATVTTVCYVGAWSVHYAFVFYQIQRKQDIKRMTVITRVLVSYFFMIPGLFLGFKLAARVCEILNYQYSVPSLSDYSSGIIFGILVSSLFLLFEVIRQSKEAKQLAEIKFRKLENEKLKAQVSALTAQMNPHLLFNSLNTIVSTITSDPRSAEDMVVKLSELYRGILKSAKGDMHTLENELDLCRSYLEIEKKRFGSRVQYQIFIDENLDAKKINIPVLLLQPLVENAIKHGLTSKKEGGVVRIEVRKDNLDFIVRVVDNGLGPSLLKSSSGTGTGLSNCESRVSLKYGESSKFTFVRYQSETIATVIIPFKDVFCD